MDGANAGMLPGKSSALSMPWSGCGQSGEKPVTVGRERTCGKQRNIIAQGSKLLAIFLYACSLSAGADDSAPRDSDALFEQLFADGYPSDESLLREARALWEKLAEDGDPNAQYYLSRLYWAGVGDTPLDQEKALLLSEMAATGGHRDAQHSIARVYELGLVLDQDNERAVMWYEKAARNGSSYARMRLARAYTYGELGLPRDPERAEQWRAGTANETEVRR